MSKTYRCIYNRDDDDSFTVGKVYTLNDQDQVTGEDGYTWGPHEEGTIQWLENHGWYRFEEVKSMEFTLSDIKTGDMIRTEAGELMVAMRGCGIGSDFFYTFKAVFPGKYEGIERWNEDLSHCYLNDYDIVEVRRPDGNRFDILNLQEEWDDADMLWTKEPKRKRMTVDEIESALGYKVAIVDADGKEEK